MEKLLLRPIQIFCLLILFSFLSLSFVNPAFAQKQAVKRTNSGIWYLEYLPKNYGSGEKSPVIIFLHGAGEKGNGPGSINLIKKWGPPRHVEEGENMTFQVNGKSYGFVVITPQLPTNKSWTPAMVDDIINHTLKTYKVDPDRVYLTGLSLGGGATWLYATSSYNKPNKLAAIAPICGFLSSSKDVKSLADNNVAVWGFHNSQDNIISLGRGKAPVDKLKSYHPKSTPKFTIYNAKGHNAWTKAYTTNNSVHSPNLYQWFLSQKRGKSSGNEEAPVAKNQAPIAQAGSDQTLQLPKNYATLNGGSSSDKDGSISKYYWKKISGPSATIVNASSASTKIKSLREGKYVFELAVTDNKGATAKDQMTVLVSLKGAPVAKPAEEKPSEPAVADKGVSGRNGLHYKYYEGNRMREVADVSAGKSTLKKQGTIANFNISPKQRKYYFGFEYEGYIEIKKAGTYTFYTTSDDGSALWIGSKKVVNNDGVHTKSQRSGSITLKAGMHAIKVAFFEHAQGEMLQVAYAGPGISKREIPNSVLFLDGSNARIANSGKTPSTKQTATAESPDLDKALQPIAVKAYPNPVIDVVHVELGGEQGEVATISVIDQLGRVVYSEEKTMSGYAQTVELNLSALGLKPGMTFLQVDAPSYGKKTIKLLKTS